MKLAALRLFVRDLVAARDFYAAQLGLPLQHDGSADGFCVFDLDGIDLVVEAVPADAPAEEQALVGRFTGLSFAVEDIAATHARLVAVGVPFGGPPQLQFWGGTLATLSDPAGNQLQLVQYPTVVPAP
ncbi:MAG: VOC family protein [Burkholderiaceae bacterium]|nr:VOC family protein [Burkholderiaceae bacterium]